MVLHWTQLRTMCQNEICGDKCSPTTNVDSSRTVTDGGTAATDLTQFQVDILAVVAEESRYGLAIKRKLEAVYNEPVNHGRLYPNLDDLEDIGLVRKRALDRRTNEVIITDAGRSVLRERIEWLADRAGLATVDDEHRLANAKPADVRGDD